MALIYSSFLNRFFSFKLDVRIHQHARDKGFFSKLIESMVRKTDSEKRSEYFGSDPFQ
jgi:hypothetical protein